GATRQRTRTRRDRGARGTPAATRGLSGARALCDGRQLRPGHRDAAAGESRMRRTAAVLTVGFVLVGCHTARDEHGTISQLRNVEPDVAEVPVDNSLVSAMAGYRQFLNATPNHAMAPEAMRRLADLQIEKDYGVMGGKGGRAELPAPSTAGDGV